MEHSLGIDLGVYSLECIKRAAYRLSDRFSTEIAIDQQIAHCKLIFSSNRAREFVELSVDAFRKELLDQDLREIVRRETEGVRNLILAHAFSKTGLIGDESV